jgi:hypothetical protein
LAPELVVPLPEFITGNFTISGCGVETLVPKVLLKKPEAISRVVEFGGMVTVAFFP